MTRPGTCGWARQVTRKWATDTVPLPAALPFHPFHDAVLNLERVRRGRFPLTLSGLKVKNAVGERANGRANRIAPLPPAC